MMPMAVFEIDAAGRGIRDGLPADKIMIVAMRAGARYL